MRSRLIALLLIALLLAPGCGVTQREEPRLSLFVGIDVSGSFTRTPHFKDSLRFLSYYLYGHLNGAGGLQKPRALYVGSIGGDTPNEPKAFYPIQEFQRKSPREIEAKLTELFSARGNFLTDFNAFFQRVSEVVRKQNLILAPITIVIVTDGVFEAAGPGGKAVLPPYEKIDVSGLEYLARNITIRVLYPTPKVAAGWERKIPRQRVRVWPVEAEVMGGWHEQIENRQTFEDEKRLWKWIHDIVDRRARRQTVG
ncbi:MAG: hypothetical protein HYY54_07300 [candidate division NC10 bacterium]|nr:hypothetical protein [candidate division NC10 bacterium]MBI3003405.1 hypothetical protein [candidate division NC10 bacterium]